MTTLNLWIVFDHSPDDPRPPELVACGPDVRPNEIVKVPIAYAENRYIGEYDGGGIYPWTETDAGIEQIAEMPTPEQDEHDTKMMILAERWQEQDANQRRKRGE